MVLILKRRFSGCSTVKRETITSKFHGKKWSKIVNNNSYTLIVLLLCFSNCWREANSLDDGIITLPNTSITLSQLFNICTNQTTNGFDTVKIIQVMHFDFCNEFHPVFFAPPRTTKIQRQIELNNTKLNPQIQTVAVDAVYNCSHVQALYRHEAYFQKVYTDYAQLLDRTDDCTIQKVLNCTICKNTYREWTCSMFASQYATALSSPPAPVCPYLFSQVCHDCPSLQPDKSYGGYSIFQCVVDDENGRNCMMNTNTNSSSCSSFSCLPSYDETTIRILP